MRRLVVLAACLCWPVPALALQPIEHFVRGAEASHPDLHEASAVREQRKAERQAALWRLLPTFAASGSYTRNQYQVDVTFPGFSEPTPIIAQDQLDAVLKLTVPIVNVAAWEAKAASSAQLELAAANSEVIRQDLRRRVARSYYQLLATSAVRQAAERSLALAHESATVARTKRDNGAATELEVERALADVARTEQDVTASVLAETLARRDLHSLSGIEPTPASVFPEDDLHPEAPLAVWIAGVDSVPALDAARAAERAVRKQASAAKAWLVPVVTGTAEERFTNATALFGGNEAFYAFKVNLTWSVDGASHYASKSAQAQISAAEARELGRRREVEDAIFVAWHQVEAGLQRARSARRQAKAATRASELAQAQYEEGVATQLDVLSSRQTAFLAEVGHIQADADLGYSRVLLRILTARDLEPSVPPDEPVREPSGMNDP